MGNDGAPPAPPRASVWPLFGCSGALAVVFFLAGVLLSSFADVSRNERIIYGVMSAGMAFVASILLSLRDRSNRIHAHERVRTRLLSRSDLEDNAFFLLLPDVNEQVAVAVRSSLARFFDVPETKIDPSDNLESDLEYKQFVLGLHSIVVNDVVGNSVAPGIRYSFPSRPMKTLADFIREIERVVNSLR